MDPLKKGVETPAATAPNGQPTVTPAGEGGAVPPATVTLTAEEHAKLLSELQTAQTNAENYKQGMLIAKGKKPAVVPDLSTPEKIDEHIKNTVAESELDKQAAEAARKKVEEDAAKDRRLAELERMVKAGVNAPAPSAGGSAPLNDPKPKDPTEFWTKEQKDWLRTNKRWDDATIAAAEARARSNNPFSEQANFLPTRKQ